MFMIIFSDSVFPFTFLSIPSWPCSTSNFFPKLQQHKNLEPNYITRLTAQTWFISKRDFPTNGKNTPHQGTFIIISFQTIIYDMNHTRRMCVQTETVRQARGERIDRPWVYWLGHSQVGGSVAPIHTKCIRRDTYCTRTQINTLLRCN